MARQDADLARGGSGEDERRPRPTSDSRSTATISTFSSAMSHHLSDSMLFTQALIGRRRRSQLGAEAQPSSPGRPEPPIRKNACSGRSSKSPLVELVERLDGLLERHGRTRLTRELVGRRHVLAQEALDAPRPVDQLLVLLGQLVDTEDGDDVPEGPCSAAGSDDFLCTRSCSSPTTAGQDGRLDAAGPPPEDALLEHARGTASSSRPGARTSLRGTGRCSHPRARRWPAST